MSHQAPQILTPVPSRKRKVRDAFGSYKPPTTTQPPSFPATNAATAAALPNSSNRLLAGYMAYEFLTKGTLLGQKYEPGRAGSVPLSGSSAEPSQKKEYQSYAEVANILKTDEAHIQGIVNPAQLAHWIRM